MLFRGEGDAADGAVDSWLERLGSSAQRQRPPRAHVRYVLDRREIYYVPRVELEAYVVTASLDGTLGGQRPVDVATLGRLGSATITPADRTISRLAAVAGVVRSAIDPPSPPVLAALLELAIETGRLHWHAPAGPPLTRFEIASRLTWRTGSDGRQRLTLEDRPQAILVPSKPVWYVDPQEAQAGPVELGIPPDVAAAAATAPALTLQQAARSQIAWRRAIPAVDADPPEAGDRATFVDEEPSVVLEVGRVAERRFVRLHFAYGERVVRRSARDDAFATSTAYAQRIWPRRRDAEERALRRLLNAGFQESVDDRLELDGGEAAWARFAYCDLPALQRDGWRVDAVPGAPAVIEPDELWDANVSERGDRWFDLDLGVTISGERVALLPILVQALRERDAAGQAAVSNEPLFVRLPSGEFAVLPGERVSRLINALVELFDDDPLTAEGRLGLPPAALGALASAIAGERIAWTAPESARSLYADLDDFPGDVPVSLPPEFCGTLRPYQNAGVRWLQRLAERGFGAVLADDMGLGKTVQLLAHAAIERAAGRLSEPVLIVAPTSVVPNWRVEIARFTPAFSVLSLTGPDRDAKYERIDEADIVLTTYALLRRDADRVLGRRWSLAVLDEAQAIKNPASKGAHVARRLRARQHVALTGTPIENHLGELWSIFAFAVPALLGDRAAFARHFRMPIEKQQDAVRRRALGARVRPFLLRRTKENVETDLPPKSDIVVPI
ncbi:MAG TPA: SNF2-related protein, partial [Candidatus Tumulicola sp.]|nr:SNF2-related protein [Candidatus Tumulicola sp.]